MFVVGNFKLPIILTFCKRDAIIFITFFFYNQNAFINNHVPSAQLKPLSGQTRDHCGQNRIYYQNGVSFCNLRLAARDFVQRIMVFVDKSANLSFRCSHENRFYSQSLLFRLIIKTDPFHPKFSRYEN